ncbi:putative LysR family transcriptional regulator [Gordonia polyisoprenivorans NBRC 16320 = JCM 10675]|uniref:LysR family transcriptional regulator n=1 Tax=Gordonia polyisoprenivorans TaxID=84595 RepID=A0A846WNR0_9ACTN|nr:LysR substrate-binding domain-containing protein [Gordonia polyisoprenivorans]MBE7191037.1 LysR family transcriptional regulator [Gordonia polyisoprenivorans]NKY03029.1 LysR family transcriptional regulator [Gordonia polyisoprenivorans]OZC34353.1 LysR family transcriptional regulator [Gordonia polyisoprenivorans]QUD85886.1 LysR family transcriptional regulator [Gordonia polyisoprenivorans]WCB40268.1 LysR substrate-binding domain-containing protein [Gordonia polyisoprenivorans]
MLNVSRLRILRELHLRGTLAQVAEALSYTPSAISQQLSLLEREAGVALLERVGRGVRLTDQALTLVAHAEVILAELERAEVDLAQAQPSVHGVLRVSSFQSVVAEIVPRVLTLLERSHPALQVELTLREVEGAYRGLLSHTFDLILGEQFPGRPSPVRPGTDRADLIHDRLLLAVPAQGPLAVEPSGLAELAELPWALEPAGTDSGEWARAVCRSAGFEPRVRFDGPDTLLHSRFVANGHALAFVPALIAGDDPRLRLYALPGDPERSLFTAVRTGRSGHPAVRAFRDALAQAAAERGPQVPSVELFRA